MSQLPGRNKPCHCGSGRKYKRCCLEKDREKAAHILAQNNPIDRVMAGFAVRSLVRRRLVS